MLNSIVFFFLSFGFPFFSFSQSVSGKENKTLADRFGNGQKKVLSQFSVKPSRSVLGVNSKVNVKDGVQTGWQGTHLKRPTDTSTQPRPKPALKKRDAALQPAASLSRNRSTAGVPSAVWKSSKSDSTAAPIPASRFRSGSKSAWSCQSTAGSRISLGCLVYTRTGLVPAVTQSLLAPSQSLARVSAPTTTVAKAAATDKSRHKTTSASVAVCKRPAAAQKSLPPSALSKAVRDKGASTIAAGDRKTKVPPKPSSRPSLLPPKSQTTNGLKSTCSTSSCTTTLDGAKFTARGITSCQPDRRPTGNSTRRTFEREGNRNIQQVSASSRLPNQVAASSCRGLRRSAPAATAATAANAVKEKSSIHTNAKKEQSFVNDKPPQVGLRRTVSSVTVPQPPRITSHTRRATVTVATKTPAAKTPAKAAPQTEGAKLTAAQEARM